MRLTTKGRYAVTAMLDLALHGSDGPIPVKEWQKLDLGRSALHSDEGSAVSPKAKDASEPAPSQVRDGQL